MTQQGQRPEGRTVAEGLAEIAVDGAKEIIALRADRDALAKRVGELTEALERAASEFERYAREHDEKAENSLRNGLPSFADQSREKAINNRKLATICRTTLTKGTNNG